jgi:hypothetical protein
MTAFGLYYAVYIRGGVTTKSMQRGVRSKEVQFVLSGLFKYGQTAPFAFCRQRAVNI